eukprot:SAG25_NODE_9026_length_391_cov_2.010274_2_plen_84_part_01
MHLAIPFVFLAVEPRKQIRLSILWSPGLKNVPNHEMSRILNSRTVSRLCWVLAGSSARSDDGEADPPLSKLARESSRELSKESL